MPLYEYECFLCHHRFERIQKPSAEPLRECPQCGGSVRRLLGVPALQFKGSGWYVTDYGKGGSRGATDTSSTSSDSDTKSSPADTSSTTKTTSEPAKKAAS
jgi:putative FmdB family regulatory protein